MNAPLRPQWPALLLASATLLLSACQDDNHKPDAPPAETLSLSLAFSAPEQAIDLSNYTRVARYPLPTRADSANKLAAEASAVAYDRDTDSLYIVGDSGTAVVQVSKTGELIDAMTLAADASKPQGTYFYDTEGLAYAGNGQFVLIEERYRQANLFTYAGGATLDGSGARSVKLGTTIGNIGLEGVSYDPLSGGYIFVKEKTPIGVFQTTIDFDAGTASNGAADAANSTDLFDPTTLGVADLADVFALSNVVADGDGARADLLLLSQESGVVLQTDRSGAIKGRLDIGLSAQNEGLTMDGEHTLYLVNELGGGDGHPQLWVYKPTATRDAVGTGSRLYLTFSAAVSAGSGYLVLDDGAGDVRAIAVGDSDQVVIENGTVTIDPEHALLANRHYTLTVPDGAFKDADGRAIGDVAALADLSFDTVSDIEPPALAGSTPADDAIAVSASRLTLTFTEDVVAGAGSIVLQGDDGDTRTIAIGDATQVSFAAATVTVTPSEALHAGVTYTVQIAAGVIADAAGNAYPGLTSATALNFTMAASGAPTVLAAGDLLFVAANADSPDAIAFVLLKTVVAGTQIGFTDKNYVAANATWPSNEAAYTWTADVDYPAGTFVTIQTDTPSADKGIVAGAGGGVGGGGETYYAFQGTIGDANAGQISVDRFLAALNIAGSAAGEIPAAVSDAGAYLSFAENNVRYAGSTDSTDLAALAARIRNPDNWARHDSTPFALSNGSLFPDAVPATPTVLAAGDLLFVAANADATDAIAFVLLKAVSAGTQIGFTDKDYSAASATWPSNEAAYTWTADVDYPAGTFVTIQPGATPIGVDKGSVSGSGGGIGGGGETYYAFQGTITNADAGQISVDRFLAALNVAGAAAGEIPPAVSAANAYLSFPENNVKYTGATDASDLAALAARIRDGANWTRNDASAFPLSGGSLFP
ncbi:SdiA-regulated domain-containing protein [Solimonas variicoloris]|uniref:SdiA-regulated domain-containing protein n=1 Tax=Solimonas variicoloris TaxID=254408 RepID=UPI00035F9278|nr:SdiA-regulated domain-containing protein [Solimonas variicoloris]